MRKLIISIIILAGLTSCNGFLNVVPNDGVATVDMAFDLRSTAQRYLATCYSYMPVDGNVASDPAMLTGDELWDLVGRIVSNTSARVPNTYFQIARGLQTASKVYANDWASMYEGIRCCDILVENIDKVPDMTMQEKEQWKAEASFLKAYYHFNLVRKWGPVPVIRKSLPIDSDVETVRVYRENIDTCFNFILRLLDKAYKNLPLAVESNDELGRITQPVCAALKAKVAVYAASPLFNGNEEMASLVDNQGRMLFPAKSAEEKAERWRYAVTACEDAIRVCEQANIRLYNISDVSANYRLTDSLRQTLTLRNAFNNRWNSEVIWGNTQIQSSGDMLAFQQWTMPNMTENAHSTGGYRFIGVPLKIVDQFYTRNGLPMANDRDWDGVNPNALKTGGESTNYWMEEGYTSITSNFDREPRFYAFLGFDGGKWLGQLANYNDLKPEDVLHIECRNGGHEGRSGGEVGPVTGYFAKKLYPIYCNFTGTNQFTSYRYAWPIIRLTDLYLLYAEAVNEAEGPNGFHSDKMFEYLDAVRSRAGIPGVKAAWDSHSNSPGYYNTQYGLRNIIHRERLIELSFESQRYWDIRRWKEAPNEYSKGIYGWTVTGSAPEDYYVRKLIATQTFGLKDYFWPIYTYYLDRNPNLVQNLGW
ncbi:MAG: RagB/SusD family nutrient uptake outer membrane protein [Bacteroidales bacterium]|nr:RagB/SusD family nutrient uptake outer membrane protein [Bacteroidales bacterium]